MNGSPTARMLAQLRLITIVVLAVAVLFLAKVLLLPLGMAILLAFLLAPAVAFLERFHLPRPVAALLVILAFAALLVVVTWSLFTQLVAGIADDLPTYRENITHKMQALHSPSHSAFGRAQQELQRIHRRDGDRQLDGHCGFAGSAGSRKQSRSAPLRSIRSRCVKWGVPRVGSISLGASLNRLPRLCWRLSSPSSYFFNGRIYATGLSAFPATTT